MNEMELLKEVELQSYWADVAIAIASGDSKLAVDSASDLICRQFTFKTMLDNEELWFYESGYYKNSGENIVKKIIQDCVEIKLKISSRFINEVIASVKRKTYLDREAFEAPVHLICVGNGVFDIDGGELLPHDPKYFFKSKININYNPQADCPHIRDFVKSTFEEKHFWTAFEIPAYLLWREHKIQKAVMLNGSGDNGKSRYIELLEIFCDKKNLASEQLQSLCNDKFSTAQLYGKLGNFSADLPATGVDQTGEFKKLTGGDTISAQHKFGQPFQFKSYAKLVFSANEVPAAKDNTDAFFKRWIIIDFPFKFRNDLKEEEYGEIFKKANIDILKELITPPELEGLLNVALIKLKELMQRGTFSCNQTVEEVKNRYLIKSNSALAFLTANISENPAAETPGETDLFIEKEFLWQEYLAFCSANHTPPKTETYFFIQIRVLYECGTERRSVKLGLRKMVFSGIRYDPIWK